MRSVLIEINDARASRKAIFTNKTYQDLIDSTIPAKLIDIATEQRNLLAAQVKLHIAHKQSMEPFQGCSAPIDSFFASSFIVSYLVYFVFEIKKFLSTIAWE